MKNIGNKLTCRNRRIIAVAATAAVSQLAIALPTFAGTTPGAETVSFAGSTALRNWFVVKGTTFTDVTPGQQVSVQGVQYPSNTSNWSINGGSLLIDQLAPSSTSTTGNSVVGISPALRFEYHESGSVEGILEMANDQIATQAYVTNNIDRNPTSGNNVWVNYNQIAPAGSIVAAGGITPFSTTGTVGTNNGTDFNSLGDFYPNNGTFNASAGLTPVFNNSGGVGVNANDGQNAVQVAVSDAIPAQVFATPTTGTDSHASTPWARTPQDANYGSGNNLLTVPSNPTVATLGSPQYREVYQSAGTLNMSSGAINPRTGVNTTPTGGGTAFGSGPWTSAGLSNLTSQYVASTATEFVANPGTGLTQVDRTDAQFLETTGRLGNGAAFNMTTRDVNSGTRNVAALETGIDPSWAAGVNDDGNGNLASGQGSQASIGPGIRFSNKTAGGNELRPTVQSNRFAIGTLSINDANGYAYNGASKPNDIRALAYSDSNNGSATYVTANYYTIAGVYDPNANNYNGPTGTPAQYSIFQNEQFVTVKKPVAAAATLNSAQWANVSTGTTLVTNASGGVTQVPVQGDNSTGDAAGLLNNTLSSVAAYNGSVAASTAASPAAGLLAQGYIIPTLMAVSKQQNGLNQAGLPSQIVSNAGTGPTNYNASNVVANNNLAVNSGLVAALNMGNAAYVTYGSTSSVYGGNSLVTSGPSGFAGSIPLTSYNYLLGNFNQNGVRDFFSAVVLGQKAQASLETTGAGNSAFSGDPVSPSNNSSTGIVNSTSVSSISQLATMNSGSGPTKGDLIVLGDLNGDGKFDGKDLYDFAVDASLTSAGNRPVLTYGTGGVATLASGGTIQNISQGTTGASTPADNQTSTLFGAALTAPATATNALVLNKNVALNYLQADATANQKLEARMLLTVTSNSAPLPAGAVLALNYSNGTQITDGVYGLNQITFDSNGVNSFNQADVNQDGVVDFNDAVIIDSLHGKSYASLSDSLTASEPTPITGVPEMANLVLAQQVDTNTSIGQSDVAAVNAQLSGGSLTTNWYNGATLVKSGPYTITWQGSTGSKVNVNTGANFQISSGIVQARAAMDPFTDNNTNQPINSTDTSKSLAITVTSGGNLEYTGTSSTGTQLDRLSSLNISAGGLVTVDPVSNHTNHALLEVGGVSIAPTGKLDLGNNDMIVKGGAIGAITAQIKLGYNVTGGGNWQGTGLASSSAASNTAHLTALGAISSTGAAFDGFNTSSSDVLVKYTYFGDATLDGQVDGSDYTRIDNGFIQNLTGWGNGDFNYDGVVNGSDYTLIDNSFNTQGASFAAGVGCPTVQIAAQIAGGTGTSAVPEPATLGLLGVGVGSLLSRRRRRA